MIVVYYKDFIEKVIDDIVDAHYYAPTQISIVYQTESYFNLDYDYTNDGKRRQSFLLDEFEGSIGDVLTPEELAALESRNRMYEFTVPDGGGEEPVLEPRVMALENLTVTHTGRLNTVEPKVDMTIERVDTVEPIVSSNTDRLNTAEPVVTANTGRLDTVEPKVDTLEERMDNVPAELIITTDDISPDFNNETPPSDYPDGQYITHTPPGLGFPEHGVLEGVLMSNKIDNDNFKQTWCTKTSDPRDGYYVRVPDNGEFKFWVQIGTDLPQA